MPFPLALGAPGGTEMLMLLILAVLLFGKNLPDVARSVGKTFSDFKRGLQGIESEFRNVTRDVSDATNISGTASTSKAKTKAGTTKAATSDTDDNEEDRREAIAPKFVPPAAPPKEETSDSDRRETVT